MDSNLLITEWFVRIMTQIRNFNLLKFDAILEQSKLNRFLYETTKCSQIYGNLLIPTSYLQIFTIRFLYTLNFILLIIYFRLIIFYLTAVIFETKCSTNILIELFCLLTKICHSVFKQ